MTGERFAVPEPLLPPPPRHFGRPRGDLRAVPNGLFYLVSTGWLWRVLPHDLPPWGTVDTRYRRWRRDGSWQGLREARRRRVRRQVGRGSKPGGLRRR